MSLIKYPDERRLEQWEKTVQAQRGWNFANFLGFGDLAIVEGWTVRVVPSWLLLGSLFAQMS
ncbi:hypothetical protein TSUD_220230 [Trifolium subterraneum]|uniref:Uncharacterized protein n=1 Tax=Trifolium subterraneum TaxID=3900 RepID=A0A2Z6P7M1_TRISU|nr:hypothetical protein TSUD_220230 [Trifolium subterraneum]